jgi:hypothetical protein
MLLRGNEKVGYWKHFIKAEKVYWPLIRRWHDNPRALRRRRFKTAKAAIEYGEKALMRYRRWCEIAMMTQIQPAGHTE